MPDQAPVTVDQLLDTMVGKTLFAAINHKVRSDVAA
jgi:hypothetical protein